MSRNILHSEVRDWPLWWFAGLEAALNRGDYASAARALRQLEHLGVSVRYRIPRKHGTPQRGGHCRAEQ